MDDKKMEAEKRAKNLDVFFSAILALESKDECDKFFEDIFTAQELIDIPQRLEVAIPRLRGSIGALSMAGADTRISRKGYRNVQTGAFYEEGDSVL